MIKYIAIILFVFSTLSAAAENFETELISRGRVELMRSFHKHDSAEVLSNIVRLDSMNYGDVNSISKNEKEVVLLGWKCGVTFCNTNWLIIKICIILHRVKNRAKSKAMNYQLLLIK